ncbi:MAG: acetyl-CoA carboxylase carboxyltransferase subunit alpha [Opitutales bacterium]
MAKPTFQLDFEKPLAELMEQLEGLRQTGVDTQVDLSEEIEAIENKIEATKREIYTSLTPWQRVQLSRHPRRPYALDYIERLFTDFQELHGDRLFRDDRAIIGGTALYHGEPVMIVAQQKGRETKENIERNFGYPNPEGYRKALRLMKLAERFQLPVIVLVDTPGAFPGIGSEERHVAEAIAVNLREMAGLTVPILATVIGEGGSGGALGIAVADVVMILQNAYYSVIAPESCATILFKDKSRAAEAAENLRITADELLKLGIVDKIVEEPFGGAHISYDEAATYLDTAIGKQLKKLRTLDTETLLERRYQHFRRMGVYTDAPLPVAEALGEPQPSETAEKPAAPKAQSEAKETSTTSTAKPVEAEATSTSR